MTKLSVNVNKIAVIRNSRGGDLPDLGRAVQNIERFGAQGITVHPRPDERHIRFADLPVLAELVSTELNIEGNPDDRWLREVLAVKPQQATLVPDAPGAITSTAGWDTIRHKDFLREVCTELKSNGIRVSIFVSPIEQFIEGAAEAGADRIELYTGPYARQSDQERAVEPYAIAASAAVACGLGVNAGHDLNLQNLGLFCREVPHLAEVSIGHALISDALYLGLEESIRQYLKVIELAALGQMTGF